MYLYRNPRTALVCLLVFVVALLPMGTLAKGVYTTVEAPWSETPFYQEGCEWAARSLGDDAFYHCMEASWIEKDRQPITDIRLKSQQTQYNNVRQFAVSQEGVDVGRAALFEAEMAARSFSPAVELHYKLAVQEIAAGAAPLDAEHCGEAFAAVYHSQSDGIPFIARGAERLLKLIENIPGGPEGKLNVAWRDSTGSQILHHGLDHSHPASCAAPDAAVIVIVYGLPSNQPTAELHRAALTVLASRKDATYVMRHLPISPIRLCHAVDGHPVPMSEADIAAAKAWAAPLVVPGYGVTVDVKSTEYKVTDERAAAAAKGRGFPSAVGQEDVVGGFYFNRLQERYAAAHAALLEFSAVLANRTENAAGGHGELRVDLQQSELRNMGLAAAKLIQGVKHESRRLHTLKDVVNRFPYYANELSKKAAAIREDDPLARDVARLTGMLQSAEGRLFVNGWEIEPKDASLHTVLYELQKQETFSTRLRTILTHNSAGEPDAFVRVAQELWDSVSQHVIHASRKELPSALQKQELLEYYAIPSDAVYWLNDIEKDAAYAEFSSSLSVLGSAHAPVFFRFPRRNLVHYVCLIDPVAGKGMNNILFISQMMSMGIPLRVGMAFIDPLWASEGLNGEHLSGIATWSSPSLQPGSRAVIAVTALLDQCAELGDFTAFFEFAMFASRSFAQFQSSIHADGDEEKVAQIWVSNLLELARSSYFSLTGEGLDEYLEESDFLDTYSATQAKLAAFDFGESSATLLNGALLNSKDIEFETLLAEEAERLDQLVKKRVLRSDMDDFYDTILRAYGARTSCTGSRASEELPVTVLPWASPAAMHFVKERPYLYSPTYDMRAAYVTQIVTVPCTATVETLIQLRMVLVALQGCGQSSSGALTAACLSTRITLALCSSSLYGSLEQPTSIMGMMESLMLSLRDTSEIKRLDIMLHFLDHVIEATRSMHRDATKELLSDTAFFSSLPIFPPTLMRYLRFWKRSDVSAYAELQRAAVDMFWSYLKTSAAPAYATHTPLLLTNGVVADIGGAPPSLSALTPEKVVRLIVAEARLAAAVEKMLESIDFVSFNRTHGFTAESLTSDFFATKVSCLASVMRGDYLDRVNAGDRTQQEETLLGSAEAKQLIAKLSFSIDSQISKEEHGGFATAHTATIIVDPASRDAQLLVALADFVLSLKINIRVQIILLPSLVVRFPIRNFYQYVSAPRPVFTAPDGRVSSPMAVFRGLPVAALLTLGLEEPHSWTVSAHKAEYDLDNIMLSTLPSGTFYVAAVYRLSAILLTGSTSYTNSAEPPNGMPLALAYTESDPDTASPPALKVTDTLVMANQNGYYQLKAAASPARLSILPGPVGETFYISQASGLSVPPPQEGESFVTGGVPVLVDSFRGVFLHLRVKHRPGKEGKTLKGILGKMAASVERRWPPRNGTHALAPIKPTLNIFSVASGHLYERFLRMMFYSVMQTSKDKFGEGTTRIKFWVIENFLSPQFKKYIPLMAAHYGFEVAFVTYRWPWWLRRQTEKQRKIWGYKILFLDVIFPLDVDRVIFVDADQRLQADLHELYNMDIDGHSIAMTPFCTKEKNEATVPFRFWNHGFWKKHLGSQYVYHISAIFLVDLAAFRATFAGDIYRLVYDELSLDPDSLSNLDQDLPNYVQNQIPMFSLPEEWLWCETWCSAESKDRAKTIDLCNNPLTKMPKLDNAKMVIPGWEDLDNELQATADALLRKDNGVDD